MEDIKVIFEKAIELVKECGELLKNVDYDKEVAIKEDSTIVTKYDMQIDRKLTEGLKQITDCSVFSEEHAEEQKDTYFIIDPIDGTNNFSIGFEYFCIMVAFVKNKTTLFSIVYAPVLDKMFTAIKGEGAYLNNKKIHVKKQGDRTAGIVSMGGIKSLEYIEKITKSKKKTNIKGLGSTGISICYTARGIFDFCVGVNGPHLWDYIPPKLIIEEAGGVLKYKEIDKGRYDIIAGSKEIVDEINGIIHIV